MGALFAQAAAAAARHIEESLSDTVLNDAGGNQGEQGIPPLRQSRDLIPETHLLARTLSLPMLESLAIQILTTLGRGPYEETIKIIQEPESEAGQSYATLKSLFDHAKKMYSPYVPFLSADELSIDEPNHRATIHTANLAIFAASVFGGQEVGFYELNDNFLETFAPDGAPLEEKPGQLYINLKTQMFLSAVLQEEQEKTKEDLLDDFFPASLDDLLSRRHLGIPLSQNELEFIRAVRARRELLMNETSDVESIQLLSEKYDWEDFLRSLSGHLNSVHEPLITVYLKRHSLALPTPLDPLNSNTRQHENSLPVQKQIEDDISVQAELAAQEALRSVYAQSQYRSPQEHNGDLQQLQNHQQQSPQQQQQQQLQQLQHEPSQQVQPNLQPQLQQTYHPQGQNGLYQPQYPAENAPYPTQSAPTQVLYERARQAAVAKANPGNNRRPGLPSQRRPWSTDEEHALMAGLDQVKGPHWSQILALYGPDGTVNNILKDRNQVQLKDKARNLKLFFLKSNIEVPYYLQCVTGELKTRAPSQAARKEAEERARLASDEEQARFNGIMALAGGMQDQSNSHARSQDSRIQTPDTSRQLSHDSLNTPEKLHVVEPDNQQSTAPQLSEEELLRQRLMAATADSLQSIGVNSSDVGRTTF